MKLDIIGISGKAGAGKDFIGRHVLRPLGFNQWAFAWPMKVTCIGQGFTYEEVFETKPPAVRDALQQIGTEKGWMVWGKDYWLKQAAAWLRIMQTELGLSKFYFSDVRFPHEVEFVQSLGGKVVRIEPGNRPLRLTGPAALHSSETALDHYHGFDAVIENYVGRTPESLEDSLRFHGILPAEEVSSGEICIANYDEWMAFKRWQRSANTADDAPLVPINVAIDEARQSSPCSDGTCSCPAGYCA